MAGKTKSICGAKPKSVSAGTTYGGKDGGHLWRETHERINQNYACLDGTFSSTSMVNFVIMQRGCNDDQDTGCVSSLKRPDSKNVSNNLKVETYT